MLKLYKKNPERRFLINYKAKEIEQTSDKILAYIINRDPISFNYLPEKKLKAVCDLLPKTWFTTDLIQHLRFNTTHYKFLRNNFSLYFAHVDLYIPLNNEGRTYREYETSYYEHADYGRAGGWKSYTTKMNDPVIWDIKTFENHTGLPVRHTRKVYLTDKSKIVKIYESYLEMSNYLIDKQRE